MRDAGAGRPLPPGRRTSFRRLILLLMLGVALPLLGLTGLTVWRTMESEQARFENHLLATARALALAVERELGQSAAMVRIMASSNRLPDGDLAGFHAHAARVVPPGVVLILYDADGRQLLNSSEPFGSPALANVTSAVPHHIRLTLQDDAVHVSDLFFGARMRQPNVMISRRVLVRGEPHVLGLSINTRRLRELLLAQGLPEGWTSAVLDSRAQIVARTRAEEELLGHDARPAVRDQLRTAPAGLVPNAPTLDGVLSVTAVARVGESNFGVALAASTLPPWHALLQAAGPALAIGIVLVLLGLGLAVLLGRKLVAAMASLTLGAPARPTGILEVDSVAARIAEANAARNQAMETLRRSEERYRITVEAFAGGVYECFVQENRVERSRGNLAIVGETQDVPGREWWLSRIHPEDRPAWEAARATIFVEGSPSFEVEYRVRHASGRWVWVWHRSIAQRDGQGQVVRMTGSIIDITAERETQAARDLLAREMDHRVKNSFALVAGLASAAAADHPEAMDFADDLRGRLQALTVAHDLTRGAQGVASSLRGLIARLARPYGDAVTVEGGDARLTPEQATPLALVLHEWLTNAVKHGGLSVSGGSVRIEIGAGPAGNIRLDWSEHGGPMVHAPAQRGFGSALVASSAEHQLRGRLEEEWSPAGLRMRFTWPGELLGEPAPVESTA